MTRLSLPELVALVLLVGLLVASVVLAPSGLFGGVGSTTLAEASYDPSDASRWIRIRLPPGDDARDFLGRFGLSGGRQWFLAACDAEPTEDIDVVARTGAPFWVAAGNPAPRSPPTECATPDQEP